MTPVRLLYLILLSMNQSLIITLSDFADFAFTKKQRRSIAFKRER